MLVIVCGLMFSRAAVEGDTAKQRIASICRLADERPWGAGEAIASAAREDSDPTVRRVAMIALGRFEDEQCRSAVQAGTQDSSPLVRQGAAIALGRHGDDAAVETLGKLMNTDPDEDVRAAAATGLGYVPRPKSVALLALAIANSDSHKVKSEALRALSKRYKITWNKMPDPRDAAGWAEAVGVIYSLPFVKQALGAPAEEEEPERG